MGFWFYFIVVVSALIIGALLEAFLYFIHNSTLKYLFKRMPKNAEQLQSAKKLELMNEKEVEDNARTELNRYRTFDKLRRIASGTGDSATAFSTKLSPRTPEPSRRESVQMEPPKQDTGTERDKQNDNKSVKLNRPTDI